MSDDDKSEGRVALGLIIAGVFMPVALVLAVGALVWLFLLSTANAQGLASAPFPKIKAALEKQHQSELNIGLVNEQAALAVFASKGGEPNGNYPDGSRAK